MRSRNEIAAKTEFRIVLENFSGIGVGLRIILSKKGRERKRELDLENFLQKEERRGVGLRKFLSKEEKGRKGVGLRIILSK